MLYKRYKVVSFSMKTMVVALAGMLLIACPSCQKQNSDILPEKALVYQTAQNTGDLLSRKDTLMFVDQQVDQNKYILIDPKVTYQTFEGFGGAFTESAASNFYRMSAEKQKRILSAYFDPNLGNGYTICRVHMNSCDFSTGNWACDTVNGDVELKHFSIEHDKKQVIPFIKKAKSLIGSNFKLFISPWSPPAWMKTNNTMLNGGKLKPEYREAWAKYFCRFIKEYQNEGLPIWGLTVQNEPAAVQKWESCIYSAEEERDFIRDFLGPQLHKEGLGDKKLMIWDHNRDLLYERAKVVLDDPEAARYVWGVAFHWYVGDFFDNVQKVHDAYPDKKLFFTEGCQEGGPHFGEWNVGERYAHSIVNDLNRWTVGWVDWNLILDSIGGYNHTNNLCSAPIHVFPGQDSICFNNSYYYIGQFSRFIRPGAKRILTSSTSDDLEVTAFINTDNKIAVVVVNRTEKEIHYYLKLNRRSAKTKARPHSIVTFVI